MLRPARPFPGTAAARSPENCETLQRAVETLPIGLELMKWTSPIVSRWTGCLLLGIALLGLPQLSEATQLYSNAGPFLTPWISPTGPPGLPSPAKVPGKEYSHDFDSTTVGAVGSPPPADAEQVIAWDGYGGAMDGIDYSNSTRTAYPQAGEVDALASFVDTLFLETLDDKAHLIFSVSRSIVDVATGGQQNVPSAGPVLLSNGKSIGGSGELSYELAGVWASAGSQGLWASQATINAMPGPIDVDAIELWGAEPNPNAVPPLLGDSNRYSLENDFASGTSVWKWKKNPDNSYTSSPYVAHSLIVNAVLGLLGPAEGLDEQELATLIDLDALMAYDMPGTDTGLFSETGDRILFSIRQIADGQDDSGYYATGSEIFWLDASGSAGFLHHGGHDWDKAYALGNLAVITDLVTGVVDINALEAVAVEAIPEPATAMLLVVGCVLIVLNRRRQ
jgi:hypothetical protein